MTGDGIVQHSFVMPHWLYWFIIIVFPIIFLLLARWRKEAEAAKRAKDNVILTETGEKDIIKKAAWKPPGNRLTRVIDSISHNTGIFAALWTIVCVSYYSIEVVARYFFDAPTNWVHEGSFLMFGVMYTMGGAALYLADGHVRVDVFYSKWTIRQRAAADIVTSVLFNIFVLAMLFSGWIFFAQGLDRNILPDWLALGYNMDISQTEWQIPYWPIKFAIPLGAFLVFLQGISKFIKDLQAFRHLGDGRDG
jgi:TRAP-type mannitol/chloroaromatic compound transport system permease small subunit